MSGRTLRVSLAGLAAGIALAVAGPAAAQAGTVWLCKPGQSPNPCAESLQTTYIASDGASTVGTPKAGKRKIDCFYVYPTVSDQTTTNADLTVDPQQTAIARYQASRFSQHCRVFAPMYRQVTISGISDPNTPDSAWELAYSDVRAAWAEYLKKFNKGRGAVLIGHSQGTGMLTQLIREKVDNSKKARRKLISALLLGGNVTVKRGSDRDGAFKNVPACKKRTQRGCVVAFSTFNETPPANPAFGSPTGRLVEAYGGAGRTDLEVLCNNPAALGGGSAPLQSLVPTAPFPGTLGFGITILYNGSPPTAATPWVQPQDHYTGACVRSNGAHVLMLSPVAGARTMTPVPDPTWGLHLADVNIALGDLVGLVRAQSGAYLKALAKANRKGKRRR